VNDVSFFGHRVVVTGGLGFIGSALARELVQRGALVTVVDSLVPECAGSRANVEGIEDDIRIAEVDLRDRERLRPLLAGAEIVFNLAGHMSHIESMREPLIDLELNAHAQLSLLETCRSLDTRPTIVFASTRQVYGRPGSFPVEESHPTEPVDVNGVHKLAAEQYHMLYHRVHGFPVCILRLTNTYGPRMRIEDARHTFLGAWIGSVLRGEEFEVWGDGTQVRDFTYVDDAVAAFLAAATSPLAVGRILNLGDVRYVSLRALADLLLAANGGGAYRLRPFPECRKTIDIGDYAADYSAAREVLGWRPTVSLELGLPRTLAFFRERAAVHA
jgi:UDP-glucose 4-epimerase